MPRRYLRDGILTSESINSLTPTAELFYRRLMSVIDDWGLFDGRHGIIRAACYPLQLEKTREADIARWIAECEKAGVIALYKVNDKPYLYVRNTKFHRRSDPKFPIPDSTCAQLRADVLDPDSVFDSECDTDSPPKPPKGGGRDRGRSKTRGGSARDKDLSKAARDEIERLKRIKETAPA